MNRSCAGAALPGLIAGIRLPGQTSSRGEKDTSHLVEACLAKSPGSRPAGPDAILENVIVDNEGEVYFDDRTLTPIAQVGIEISANQYAEGTLYLDYGGYSVGLILNYGGDTPLPKRIPQPRHYHKEPKK